MQIDLFMLVLMGVGLFLWCVVCWSIGFKQGKEEGYTAGYMKGRNVGRSSVGTQ